MKMILLPALFFLMASGTVDLVGRWESLSPAGNITGVVFKNDNSFEGYVNSKPFVTGTYFLRDSSFQLQDNGCNGLTGEYILHFFSNNDSFRVELAGDACEGRAKGMNNRVFGRVK